MLDYKPFHINVLWPNVTAVLVGLLLAWFASGAVGTANAACARSRSELLSTSGEEVKVCGTISLQSTDVINRRVIFEGSAANDAILDCNGATINKPTSDALQVRSHYNASNDTWDRPVNVTVHDCNILGSVRVQGIASNGSDAILKGPSRQADYTQFLRNRAPYNTTFDNVHITRHGKIAVYIATGASFTRFEQCKIEGSSNSTAVYLGAETTQTIIRNSVVRVSTERELIAIDASDYNMIISSELSGLSKGGIYLYRNCGENGVSRHTHPSHNQIINNYFYYDKYEGMNPAVWLGSRDGDRSYCDEDDASSYGSGTSDRDYATDNVIAMNQIRKRQVSEMIRHGEASTDEPNFVFRNITVSSRSSVKAGCYQPTLFGAPWRDHSGTADILYGKAGSPLCITSRCNDGMWEWRSFCSNPPEVDKWNCQVTGNNAGCAGNIACPNGKKIMATTAACNLEWGTVSDATVDQFPVGQMSIVRDSDTPAQGRCQLGARTVKAGMENPLATIRQQVGNVSFFVIEAFNHSSSGNVTTSSAFLSCAESDSNGGDCHVKAYLFCQ